MRLYLIRCFVRPQDHLVFPRRFLARSAVKEMTRIICRACMVEPVTLVGERGRKGNCKLSKSGQTVRRLGDIYRVAIAFVISLFKASSFFLRSSGGESSISS